ncbi:MAG TPA: (Fe-S)-binding protein [Negativicutes bacterium]
MKASIFITCICDSIYPQVGEAMVRVLEKQGVTLDFPPRQTCCGQPAINSGYWDDARVVAKSILDSFQDSECVVVPAGSCLVAIKEFYPALFAADRHYAKLAEELIGKIYEFSEFLVLKLHLESIGACFPHKVTYHSSCHAKRFLKTDQCIYTLLDNVKDLEFIHLPHEEMCCGFGGTFSIKLPEISAAMVDEKVANIVKTGADVLVGTDMSCLMNIDGRLRKRESKVRVMHIAQLLDEGLKYDGKTQG